MKGATLSEWFLLMNLGRNMEVTVFCEFIQDYAKTLERTMGVEMTDKLNGNLRPIPFS